MANTDKNGNSQFLFLNSLQHAPQSTLGLFVARWSPGKWIRCAIRNAASSENNLRTHLDLTLLAYRDVDNTNDIPTDVTQDVEFLFTFSPPTVPTM